MVKRLADDIQWTTDLGNAFLAQQSDVMEAVQRMRKKAQDKGNLKSTEQQKVETKVIEGNSVIVIEQANPQVIYVPSYDPCTCTARRSILTLPFTIRRRGTTPRGWQFLLALASPWERSGAAVGAGVAVGAGTTCTSINNNNFNRNTNINGGNRNNIGNGNRNNIGTAGEPSLESHSRRWQSGRHWRRQPGINSSGWGRRWRRPMATQSRNIEAGLRIETERLRTGLGEQRVVILSPTANPAPGSRLAGRAAICRVPAAEELVRAIARAEGSGNRPGGAREGIA